MSLSLRQSGAGDQNRSASALKKCSLQGQVNSFCTRPLKRFAPGAKNVVTTTNTCKQNAGFVMYIRALRYRTFSIFSCSLDVSNNSQKI